MTYGGPPNPCIPHTALRAGMRISAGGPTIETVLDVFHYETEGRPGYPLTSVQVGASLDDECVTWTFEGPDTVRLHNLVEFPEIQEALQ